MPLKMGRSIGSMVFFCVEAYSNLGYTRDKGDRKLITCFYTYVDGNLVTWHSQKHIVLLVPMLKLNLRPCRRKLMRLWG